VVALLNTQNDSAILRLHAPSTRLALLAGPTNWRPHEPVLIPNMRLLAISDIHVDREENRVAVDALPTFPDDWLILGGDVADTIEGAEWALNVLIRKFAKLIWVPGNHDLWCLPGESIPVLPESIPVSSESKYLYLVDLCRSLGVLTPEDPFPLWEGEGGPHVIAPLFLLYDYSFRPDHVSEDGAVAWARESGIMCQDERLLSLDRHDSKPDWCRHRLDLSREKLARTPPGLPLILVNHFPLNKQSVRIPRIPRFSIWCGTRETETWHVDYPVHVVVYGHLHTPGTSLIDGVRFEEVSLGYPREWRAAGHREARLRTILPDS